MLETTASITDWIQTWAQPIGSFGSLFLSAALVALYVQQKNLLKANYDATHKAVVEVEDYEIDDERIILQLSNVGNAVGTDLELITVTAFEKTEDLVPDITTRRVKLTDGEITRGRQSIKSHEDNISFRARPSLGFGCLKGDTQQIGYRRAMDKLERNGIEVLRVHWYLRYQDLRGEYDGQYIDGLELDVDSEINSLETMYDQAAHMIHGTPAVNVETLEMDLSDAITDDERTVI